MCMWCIGINYIFVSKRLIKGMAQDKKWWHQGRENGSFGEVEIPMTNIT